MGPLLVLLVLPVIFRHPLYISPFTKVNSRLTARQKLFASARVLPLTRKWESSLTSFFLRSYPHTIYVLSPLVQFTGSAKNTWQVSSRLCSDHSSGERWEIVSKYSTEANGLPKSSSFLQESIYSIALLQL